MRGQVKCWGRSSAGAGQCGAGQSRSRAGQVKKGRQGKSKAGQGRSKAKQGGSPMQGFLFAMDLGSLNLFDIRRLRLW